MVLPVIVVLFAAAIAGLYVFFRRQRGARTFWRTTLLIGLAIGIARAVLASIGWYTVEHTGGPLQIPGFALSMLAWPEAALVPRTSMTRTPPAFFALLSLVLISSSVLLVAVVAGAARFLKTRTT